MASKAEIRTKVYALFATITDQDSSAIKPGDTLRGTYGLSSLYCELLATPYTNISKNSGGTRVTRREAGAVQKVDDAVMLVHKHANQ